MKSTMHRQLSTSLVIAFFVPGYLSAGVPHIFEPGTPALASEVNENFNDLDTRLAGLEAPPSDDYFFEFYLPFSADGNDKNVIVLKSYDEQWDETVYEIRSRFQNSTESVSVDGTPTMPLYISSYISVRTDSTSDITDIYSYIESSDDGNIYQFNIERSSYAPDGTNKQIIEDTSKESYNCFGGTSRICMGSRTAVFPSSSYNWHSSYNRVLVNDYVLEPNGWSFDQVSIEARNTGTHRLRIRAWGIGLILDRYENYERIAIYYRVNGKTEGSLIETPFAEGQPLHGLFF